MAPFVSKVRQVSVSAETDKTASLGALPPHGVCLYTCSVALMWPGRVWGLASALQTHCAFHAVQFVFTDPSASLAVT